MAHEESVELLHDPELAHWLQAVVDFAALGPGDPDVMLERVEDLAGLFAELRKYRQEQVLREALLGFARKRFELVDEASEYAAAGREVFSLALVAEAAPELLMPVLRQSVVALSEQLGADGVPRVFGQLLKRLRELARRSGDIDSRAWADGVIANLPGR